MNRRRFLLIYLLMVIVQIVMNVYLDFWPLLCIALLPGIILCLDTGTSPVVAMLIAFATAFATDFLSDGMLGLTGIALVPVAALRRPIISLVFGGEIFARGENISVRRQGSVKMLIAIAIATLLYLVIYVIADSAGTRPAAFNLSKVAVSLVFSTAASYCTASLLTSESGKRWR